MKMAECNEVDTEEQLILRQRKERKELQGKIQSMKHGVAKGDKKRKKEIIEEIARLELDMDKRHDMEMENLKARGNQMPAAAGDAQDKAKNCLNGEETNVPTAQSKQSRVSKAQKRRDKKAELERQREERIAEQEKLNLTGDRHLESQKLNSILKERGLAIYEIPSDGNCLYKAIAHQLDLTASGTVSVQQLRKLTASYMREHPDEFSPFLTNPETDAPFTEEEFLKYCNDVESTTAWGGHVELQALSCALKQPIQIIQAEGPPIILGNHFEKEHLLLSFHRHAFSLGEHYNSVIPKKEGDTNDDSDFS